ncbi:hypothetical protein QYE76_053599 [Lolium multiflorum]|uniref:Retrotransposon protein, putative, Ty1-copia subclass n=1 Tax=Lolium multiflorum TaxID=4521 RepID=A0AAD8WMQ0_LOLMU|nr:hypothetical protein QYE76_053599 [Lolium multiflorum]
MYLASATRPDISFAVSKLSRFVSRPGDVHWHALERVLRYLKGTASYGIHYTGYPRVLEGYSDANWISDADETKATSGYLFTLGGGAVSWKSCKQTIITRSTMEAELTALDTATVEAEWLRELLMDLPVVRNGNGNPSKEIFSELDETFAQGPIFARSFRKTEDLTKWGHEEAGGGRRGLALAAGPAPWAPCGPHKTLLDTTCSGSFTSNKEEFKRDLLDRIKENAEDWENDKGKESGYADKPPFKPLPPKEGNEEKEKKKKKKKERRRRRRRRRRIKRKSSLRRRLRLPHPVRRRAPTAGTVGLRNPASREPVRVRGNQVFGERSGATTGITTSSSDDEFLHTDNFFPDLSDFFDNLNMGDNDAAANCFPTKSPLTTKTDLICSSPPKHPTSTSSTSRRRGPHRHPHRAPPAGNPPLHGAPPEQPHLAAGCREAPPCAARRREATHLYTTRCQEHPTPHRVPPGPTPASCATARSSTSAPRTATACLGSPVPLTSIHGNPTFTNRGARPTSAPHRPSGIPADHRAFLRNQFLPLRLLASVKEAEAGGVWELWDGLGEAELV